MQQNLQLKSLVTKEGELTLFLKEAPIAELQPMDVVIKVEASPLNPSDLASLIAPADVATGKTSGQGLQKTYTAKLKPEVKNMVKARIGKALSAGNEAAGIVVEAGESEQAQAILGKRVAVMDGALYCQYRKVNVMQCMPLKEGQTARQGASCYVNPLTALSMVENMRMDGFKALVHTAAASNLGQMLNRICISEGINLVNIVRKPEQVELLKTQGAKFVLNSQDETFKQELIEAIAETEAYMAFDAIGGGRLGSDILSAMENAALRTTNAVGPYGSDVFKQLYVYGALDPSFMSINRNFGFSWGVNGWLLTPFLQKAGGEVTQRMQRRVVDELETTFASHYTKEVTLESILEAEVIQEISQQATGKKFLLCP